jgi:hypothetical protein
MSWEEICARCGHFTTIGFPELKERGEGRCTGYDKNIIPLRNPFVTWDHRVCVRFKWASPMAPRSAWIEKQQARERKSELQPETRG